MSAAAAADLNAYFSAMPPPAAGPAAKPRAANAEANVAHAGADGRP